MCINTQVYKYVHICAYMYRSLCMFINELFMYIHMYVAHTSFIQVVTCFNCKKI